MNHEKAISLDATVLNGAVTMEMYASDELISVQVSAPGTATTLTYEVSNDGTNWVAHPGVANGYASSPTPVSTSTTATFLVFRVQSRYFRIRVSTAGTGTVTGMAFAGIGWAS